MINRDEINQIRAELERVQRSVDRLSQRLAEVEARDRAGDVVPKLAAEPPVLPPPLPLPTPAVSDWNPPRVAANPQPEILPTPAKVPAPVAKAVSAPTVRPTAPPAIKKPRRFGPPEGMGWEMALTTYWFPRLGILVMALGVVWGLTFVSEKFHDSPLMPYVRVALGYVLALSMGAIGWKLEKKYPGYARVLLGGSFGFLYFVTFATWYIPPTRIAPSQEFALLLLAGLVIAWGVVAQWRKSQLIALSMTLLGHFTVALSTLSLASPSRAAVGGLLVLGIGSAWFLIHNGWYAVAMSAMVGSYLNQFFWLAKSPPSGAPLDFALGMGVLVTYLVLYALADRLTPFEYASTRTRTRNIYCGANTGGFLLLGLALMQGFDFTEDREFLLYFATALFAGAMGWSYTVREVLAEDHYTPAWASRGNIRSAGDRRPDSLSIIYFTKASMLVTAGIAAWLDGPSVTLSIALQALALLFAARRSQRPVGRILALATAALAFLHGIYTLDQGGLPVLADPDFAGYALAALLTAAVFWAVAELYRITPWHTFPQGPWRGPKILHDLCESLEMLEHKTGTPILPSRMYFSHMLIGFGALLIAWNTFELLPLYYAAPAICLLGFGIAALGLCLRSVPLLSGCAFFLVLGLYWWLHRILGGNPSEPHTPLIALGCAGSFVVVSELFRTLIPVRLAEHDRNNGIQGAWRRNYILISLILALGAGLIITTGLQERTEPPTALFAAGAMALAASAWAAATSASNIGLLGVVLALFTVLVSPELGADSPAGIGAIAGTVLAALAATAVEARWWGANRAGLAFHRLLPVPYLLYSAAAWNTVWLADTCCPDYAMPTVLALAAGAFGLALLLLHPRAMASLSAALMAIALIAWIGDNQIFETRGWHLGALAIVVISFAGDRFLTLYNPFKRPWPARLLLLWAWFTCLAWNGRMLDHGWHYTGIAFIAGTYLVYAAFFRTRTAGALALLAGVLGTLPLLAGATPGMTLSATWAAYASLIVFWIATERGVTISLARARVPLAPGHGTAFTVLLTGTPTALGILCLTRIDTIHSFYLTMSWTAWGLVIFCWALVTRQPWFRYMGLATFALTLGRVCLVDVWRLEGLYRVGATLFLGAALLSVAFGYTRWRATQSEASTDNKGEQEDL